MSSSPRPSIARRDFFVRAALLSGSGLLATTSCAQAAQASKSVLPDLKNLPRLPLRPNAKIQTFDGTTLIDLPSTVIKPTITKAVGEVEWPVRDPETGKVTIVTSSAKGAVYHAQGEPTLPGTSMLTLLGKVTQSLGKVGTKVGSVLTFYADDNYYLPTKQDMERVVPEVMVQTVGGTTLAVEAPDGYVPGRFDCDDFAFAMKGLVAMRQCRDTNLGMLAYAFGILIGDFEYIGADHAVCFYFGDDEQVHLVDPRHQALRNQPAKLFPLEAKDCKRCMMLLM